MRYQMELLLTAYYTYASTTGGLAAAAARLWAINYVWAIPAIRQSFGKLELELYAAGL